MRMMLLFSAWCIGTCSSNTWGQGKLKDFFKADSTEQCRFLNGSIHYNYSPEPGDFYIGGLFLHGGVNIARFFSKNMILGICADFKPFKGTNYWKPNASFQSDFLQSYTPDLTSTETAARSEMIRNAVLGTENKQFQGNYFGNIGIQFSPFPQQWGAWMLEVKRGYRSFPIYGYLDDPNIENYGSDFACLLPGQQSFHGFFDCQTFILFLPNTSSNIFTSQKGLEVLDTFWNTLCTCRPFK
jgi:hypothetical protein